MNEGSPQKHCGSSSSRDDPAGSFGLGIIDTCPRLSYLHLMRGRIDLELETGRSMPRKNEIFTQGRSQFTLDR